MLLCSFLNVEDLLKGDVLPLFIQTRADNSPYIFTRSDLYQATLSIDTMSMTLLQVVEHQLVLGFSSTINRASLSRMTSESCCS
jgi:hypothetical protein